MKQENILIVDDEHNTCESIKRILYNSGYNVHTAENGYEAIKRVTHTGYDLIMIDVKMPSMSGIKLLEKVKILLPEIEVVVMTAFGEIESYIEAMALGAFEYVTKPVNAEELVQIVKTALSKK